jgi:hypothetical protein
VPTDGRGVPTLLINNSESNRIKPNQIVPQDCSTPARLDRAIRLTKTQWEHIIAKHHELREQEPKIRTALQDPDFVLYSKSDDNYQYHRLFADTPVGEKHLLVVVKHLNSEGFVITAFFVSKVREQGKVKIYER